MTYSHILKDDTPDNPGGFVDTQCAVCARQNRANPTTCGAFPEGIPLVLLFGLVDHTLPYDGDQGLRYEPRDLDEPIEPADLFEPDGFAALLQSSAKPPV